MAWTVQEVDVAERILRREWERLLGFYFVEYHAFPLIHRYAQAISLDQCGAWKSGEWKKLAAFGNFTARLSPQETSSLLVAMESGDCVRYIDLPQQLFESAPSLVVDDEWYSGDSVWNLPEHGPYWSTPLGDAREPQGENFSWATVVGGATVSAIVFYTIGKILK